MTRWLFRFVHLKSIFQRFVALGAHEAGVVKRLADRPKHPSHDRFRTLIARRQFQQRIEIYFAGHSRNRSDAFDRTNRSRRELTMTLTRRQSVNCTLPALHFTLPTLHCLHFAYPLPALHFTLTLPVQRVLACPIPLSSLVIYLSTLFDWALCCIYSIEY